MLVLPSGLLSTGRPITEHVFQDDQLASRADGQIHSIIDISFYLYSGVLVVHVHVHV